MTLARVPWELLTPEERYAHSQAHLLMRRYPEFQRVRVDHWAEAIGGTLVDAIQIQESLRVKGWLDFATDYTPRRMRFKATGFSDLIEPDYSE